MILGPNDYFIISGTIDGSSTLASAVKLEQFEIECSLTHFKLYSINGVSISENVNSAHMNSAQFREFMDDPFISSILKLTKTNSIAQERIQPPPTKLEIIENAHVTFSNADSFVNAANIATLLWKLKNIVQPLFIVSLTIKSNLIVEPVTVTKAKNNKEKGKRTRFNSRKFVANSSVAATPAEMSLGVLQTLAISTFRTFYDYDADTIDPTLFNYLFNKNL